VDETIPTISTSRPTPGQVRIAIAILCLLVVASSLTAPFAHLAPANTEILVPAYAASAFVLEAVTATLLLSLFRVQRCRPLIILAAGYVFSAALVLPWALTFPDVFDPLGIDGGLQTTAVIATLRRLGFPLFVLGYALTNFHDMIRMPARAAVAWTATAVLAVAGGAVWLILSGHASLPEFMRDNRNVADLWRAVPAAALLLYAAGLGILLWRRRAALDMWVSLVLFSLAIEILLVSYLGGAVRLSVGWWAGRLYGLGAASIVLLVLLSETTAVYARLARSVAAERRARQNRLTAMEALSASIAHEINQPLAGMITNADAGLRWLDREVPRIDEARAALQRIVADGHRTSKVVAGIRAMFTAGAQERERLDLNVVVADVIARAIKDAQLERVTVETDLDPAIAAVTGNPVQLRQVVSNLVDNAIDSMRASDGHGRVLRLSTRNRDPCDVEVTVADTGAGLSPEVEARMFEPFFSTKPDGMGMGLMFCRSVVEAHGGRLWAEPNAPHGALLRFLLPAAAGDATRERRP
jgi:signal transduction histidine kinase